MEQIVFKQHNTPNDSILIMEFDNILDYVYVHVTSSHVNYINEIFF